MKVELHSHTEVHSLCSRMPARELIAMAEACAYDALFITEHGKVLSSRELAGIREFRQHLLVFPGIEITIEDGIDILVIGAEDPAYETIRDPGELFARACAEGLLTVLAHPFRWHDTLPAYCQLADAVEILTCNHPEPRQAAAARRYAAQHHMAPVYASDAHGLNFLNRFWIETERAFTTPQELRTIIVAGAYTNHLREDDAPLPPHYKAANMEELLEGDRLRIK